MGKSESTPHNLSLNLGKAPFGDRISIIPPNQTKTQGYPNEIARNPCDMLTFSIIPIFISNNTFPHFEMEHVFNRICNTHKYQVERDARMDGSLLHFVKTLIGI